MVLVQVTVFSCGGFVVGYRSSHAVADGASTAQFMAAIGELARVAESVSVAPQWCREAMLEPSSALVAAAGLPDGPDPSSAANWLLEYSTSPSTSRPTKSTT